MHLLEASLKEKQYDQAMTVMKEYCQKYGKESIVDEKAKTLSMDVSAMSPSAARMTTLLTLRKLETLVDPSDVSCECYSGREHKCCDVVIGERNCSIDRLRAEKGSSWDSRSGCAWLGE